VLSEVWNKRPFAFQEVDIVKPESKAWRDLYEFDVPVVSWAQHPDVLVCLVSVRFISAKPRALPRTQVSLARPSN
jgi:hypothetical protein